MTPLQWPASRDFVEAIQNPCCCFTDLELRALSPALDRLGMPIVSSGQFAYVFKLKEASGDGAQAVRCFRGFLGDREIRYQAIDKHLDKVSIPCVASFEYASQGILISGRKFPIVTMEWIEGLPLDVYMGDENILHRSDVLLNLAEIWLRVVDSLKVAGVAHGDLQHGNIIVQNDDLRLVDLDGMFVPEMAGWQAGELGHQHYQHPARSPKHFSALLDNFSALVIYISFSALAHCPELWSEFHDENLIFTKTDYQAPESSKLFKTLKKISQIQKLVASLEAACHRDPLDCPHLLDLVAPTSKLPTWMRTVPVVQARTVTREARAPANTPPPVPPEYRKEVINPAPPASSPWWQQQPVAVNPSGATPVSVPPSVPTFATATNFGPPSFFSGPALSQGLTCAVAWLVWIWIWFPVLFGLLQNAGSSAQTAGLMTLSAYLAFCYGMGYRRALAELAPKSTAQKTMPAVSIPASSQPRQAPAPVVPRSGWSQSSRPASRPVAPSGPPVVPASPTWTSTYSSPSGSAGYVGNRVSMVFHLPSCGWATKTRSRNRVSFVSTAQAATRGFRPCRVCRP